jgi:hypothetical protein
MNTVQIEQDGVDQFPKEIAFFLRILDHPEALVTDLSTFLDFLCQFEYPTLQEAQSELDRRLQENGVSAKFNVEWTLLEACRVLAVATQRVTIQ